MKRQTGLLRNMFGRQTFSFSGQSLCNSLPDRLRDPTLSAHSF